MRLADDSRNNTSNAAEAKGTVGGGVGDAQSKLVKGIMSRQVEQEAAGSTAANKIEVHL